MRCPFATVDIINGWGGAGSHLSGPYKVVHHKTQGASYAGAKAAYRSNRSDPHFTVSESAVYQHVDTERASRALRNESGGVQTNRDSAIQIEIVGFSGQTMSASTAKNLVRLLQWLRSAHTVPWVWPMGRPPKTSADGYGNTRHRSARVWDATGGHYGHSQVPENCVTPDTPVLCADLVWRPAGDLLVGDEIVAFDEESPDQAGRRFRTALIEHNHPIKKDCMTVHTHRGSVTATADHPWLVYRSGRAVWVKTNELRTGDELAFLNEPWGTDMSRSGGWLAGMFDADGWCSRTLDKRSGWMIGIGQRVSPTLTRTEDVLLDMGFEIKTVMRAAGRNNSNCQEFGQINVKGGLAEQLRLLGSIRPERFTTDRDLGEIYEGASVGRTIKRVSVQRVVPAGVCDVASIQTSTRTLVTGGFLTHNSHWDPAYTDDEWRFLNDQMGRAVRPAPTIAHVGVEVDVSQVVAGELSGVTNAAGDIWVLHDKGVPPVSVAVSARTSGEFCSWMPVVQNKDQNGIVFRIHSTENGGRAMGDTPVAVNFVAVWG